MRDSAAHAVRVGVGGNQQVGLDLVGKLQTQLKCLAELGVGVVARGEVSVGLGLLGNDGHVLDADLLEDAGHALHARAVKRRVDHGVVRRGLEARDGDLLDALDEAVQDLLGRPLNEALLKPLVKVHGLDVEGAHLGDVGRDLRRGLVGDLAAVVVVDLVAVVLGRVVGGREHDARGGAQVTHGKGERGHRLDARIHVDVDAVGRKHGGRHALEVLALQAGVTRERDRGVLVVGVEVVGHALGGLGHHVDVHAVGADTQDAAQAGGAKGQRAVEGVGELLLVARLDELGKLSGKVGLLDVVLPELDRGLDVLIHVVLPHFVVRDAPAPAVHGGTILVAGTAADGN